MTGINLFPMLHQSGAPFVSVRSFPKEQRYRAGVFFFLPSPSPLPCTYPKGYYFYSPQSSTVIKSKMAATTILRTWTGFHPPKIRLHCRLCFSQTNVQIPEILGKVHLNRWSFPHYKDWKLLNKWCCSFLVWLWKLKRPQKSAKRQVYLKVLLLPSTEYSWFR